MSDKTDKKELPSAFYGKPISELRGLVYGTVVGEIFSDLDIFFGILLLDKDSQNLRKINPKKFDAIIFHPHFLPKSIYLNTSNGFQKSFGRIVVEQRKGSKEGKLPKTFAGIHIDNLREQTLMRVFNIIHREVFHIEILQENPELKTLRDKDSKHFDEIVCHPDFSSEMRFGNDDMDAAVPLSQVFENSSGSSSSSK